MLSPPITNIRMALLILKWKKYLFTDGFSGWTCLLLKAFSPVVLIFKCIFLLKNPHYVVDEVAELEGSLICCEGVEHVPSALFYKSPKLDPTFYSERGELPLDYIY